MINKGLSVVLLIMAATITVFLTQFTENHSAAELSNMHDPLVASPAPVPDIRLGDAVQENEVPALREIEIFAAADDMHARWNSNTPAAYRARAIVPDADLLKQNPVLKVGDRLTLPLFDDAVLETVVSDVTPYPNGSVGMTAQLRGDRKGTVYIAYSGGELRVHADVLGGNDFYVRYDPDQQVHMAIEIDKAASDYNEKCIEFPVPQPRQTADRAGAEIPEGNRPEADAVPKMVYDAPASVVVDVMIVYTPAALAFEGSTNGINNNIALAMQKGNEAHGNSDTRVTLNLVHSAQVDYTEAEKVNPATGDPGDDLDNLTFTGGANLAMDEVQVWRDTYGADLVCLFEDTDLAGGLGWLLWSTNGTPDYGFCIARIQQTDWSYTVVHEWGHNMGCSHSKTQTSQPWESDDLYSYSAGWQWSDTASLASIGFCSVMTYENFNGSSGDEYERVPHFSNPDIFYTGNEVNPTGNVADGDNARTIRNIRQVVAEYRLSEANFTLFPFPGSTNHWFEWQMQSERVYSLYWSTSLRYGFSLLESNLVAGVYTDTVHSAEQRGFYKIEVQSAP